MAKRKSQSISPPYYTPAGRLSQAGAPKGYSPAEIRRMLDHGIANSRLPALGTAYGRMLISGAITIAEFAAFQRWSELRASYQRAIDAKTMKSASAVIDAKGGEAPDPDSELGAKITAREAQTISDYRRAETVARASGEREFWLFRQIADAAPDTYFPHFEREQAKKCASALIQLWKM